MKDIKEISEINIQSLSPSDWKSTMVELIDDLENEIMSIYMEDDKELYVAVKLQEYVIKFKLSELERCISVARNVVKEAPPDQLI